MEFGIPIVLVLLFLVFVILLLNSFRRSRSAASLYAGISADGGDGGEDSWEGAFWEAQNPQVVTANLVINYVDGAGYASEREIRVCEFDNELYGGILIAHCHLREAMRTFRFNRITKCRESVSGRPVVDIALYLSALGATQTDSDMQAADMTNP